MQNRNARQLTKDSTPVTGFEKPSQQQSSNSIMLPADRKQRASSHYATSSTPFSQPETDMHRTLGVITGCPSMPSKMQRVLINKRQGAQSTKTASRLYKRPL